MGFATSFAAATVAEGRAEAYFSSVFHGRCDLGPRFRKTIEDVDRWLLLSSRYDSWIARRDGPQKPIPRTIHQIWIGGILPERYAGFAHSWAAINPGFEYRLWNEDSIRRVLDERVGAIFEKTVNVGAKSDIARYAILERFGGLYADTDFECLRPVAPLVDRTSFLAGITVDQSPQLMNSLMGAAPGHPFLRFLLDSLKDPLLSVKDKAVLGSTGPHFLSRKFFEGHSLTGDFDIVFPTRVFYPFPSEARYGEHGGPEEIKRKFHRDEAYAIHYWEVSWSEKDGRALALIKEAIKALILWKKLGPLLRRLARQRS